MLSEIPLMFWEGNSFAHIVLRGLRISELQKVLENIGLLKSKLSDIG